MTRRNQFRQLLSHLDLKSSDNLEWVLDLLEALDDTTILKLRLQARKAGRILEPLPQSGHSRFDSNDTNRNVGLS